mmetsp:Transcript_74138/g.130858  ORF Transcript_74138/g.130858 Transcript_74138/m.130858 type:complete len:211 (-) Transcript_74138:3118-3750(-)
MVDEDPPLQDDRSVIIPHCPVAVYIDVGLQRVQVQGQDGDCTQFGLRSSHFLLHKQLAHGQHLLDASIDRRIKVPATGLHPQEHLLQCHIWDPAIPADTLELRNLSHNGHTFGQAAHHSGRLAQGFFRSGDAAHALNDVRHRAAQDGLFLWVAGLEGVPQPLHPLCVVATSDVGPVLAQLRTHPSGIVPRGPQEGSESGIRLQIRVGACL